MNHHLARYALVALALAARTLTRPASGDVFKDLPRVQPEAPKKQTECRKRIATEIDVSTSQLQFSKDGKRLVARSSNVVRFFDLAKGEEAFAITGPRHFALTADETKLVAAIRPRGENKIAVFDLKTKKWERNFPLNEILNPFCLTPDGKSIVVGGTAQPEVMDFESGKHSSVIKVKRDARWMALSPDGKRLAVGPSTSKGGKPAIWDMEKQILRQELDDIPDTVDGLLFSPDGKELAVLCRGAVVIYEVGKWCEAKYFLDFSKSVRGAAAVAYSPDSRLLAVGGKTKPGVVIWDRQKKELYAGFLGKTTKECNAVAFSPDGKTLAVADRAIDKTDLLLFDVPPVKKDDKK